MKLRTRLFLWVGIIFFLAFGISLIFEIYSTDENLQEAEKNIRKQILSVSEKHRRHIEEFLHVSLSEDQAEIDSLLLSLARDPKFGASLFIDPPNLKLIAPAHSAFFYKNDQWIDFIQTTKENALTSLMIPIDFPMLTAHKIPINDQISWVILDKDRQLDRPFIGVKLKTNPQEKKSLSFSVDEMAGIDWGLTVVFDPKNLEKWSKKPQEASSPAEEIDFLAFISAVEGAALYVRGKSKEWIQNDIHTKSRGQFFAGTPIDRRISCLKQEGEVLNNRIIQILQRGDQAIMISFFASLFPGGEFGQTLFSPEAPKGIARFSENSQSGHLVLSEEVFSQKMMFNDAAYLKTHPSSKDCENVGSSVAVIAPKNLERAFVGNTLQLEGKGGKGYLTIGIDADKLVQDLVLAIHQDTFLVHQERVISAYTENGKPISNPQATIPFEIKMLESKRGIIKWKGQEYYYLQMTPFKNLDLHFFLLEPEKEAFALVNSLAKGSRIVIKKVSTNMRMIAVVALALVLLLLHKVAKKITRPITALARITEHVASGRLEDIELPSVPKGRRDEIATLCDSFSKMVIGLKEKEKVKGVLNKVVSPEIAQEIMKGKVHLGGEERKVTVLFADIRNFTRISAEMKPTEVIEMLNTCMTKISHVIDEFGGVIDKYVGDEVMALFGAPLEKEDSTVKAVQSALKMVQVLEEWNGERKSKGLPLVKMGIGIHTGNVLIGNMGAENRLNYTVIGSNVNFAARLCSIAEGMEILISKETLSEPHVKENIVVEELPPKELKGYEETFVLYVVKGEKRVR